jgi:hypothetical protein
MKTSILILAVAFAFVSLGTSCVSSRFVLYTNILYVVDSSGLSEDPDYPGTLYKNYDTIFIKETGRMVNGSFETTYKIINKKKHFYDNAD